MASFLGPEKVAEIEENPDLFYQHERFRIWQAQARFRALATTAIAIPTICTVLNGGRNGIGFMRSRPVISGCMTIGVFVFSFYVWHRIVGYNN